MVSNRLQEPGSTLSVDFSFSLDLSAKKSDPSLFTFSRHGCNMVLLLYVDDILLTSDDQKLMDDLMRKLNTRFLMKDLGFLKNFLGSEIEKTPDGLFLHQTAYEEDVFHQAGMATCNPMLTPLPKSLSGNMENKIMDLTLTHQILSMSNPAQQYQEKKKTKQSNDSMYGKRELAMKNIFETSSRLINVES